MRVEGRELGTVFAIPPKERFNTTTSLPANKFKDFKQETEAFRLI